MVSLRWATRTHAEKIIHKSFSMAASPSQPFFVAGFLAKSLGGFACGSKEVHDQSTGRLGGFS
jgi:hypothetical protein